MEIRTILFIIGLLLLLLIEGMFEIAVLSLLGAFIRRLFGDKKKSFKEYYKGNAKINSFIGLLTLLAFFVFLFGLMKIFLK